MKGKSLGNYGVLAFIFVYFVLCAICWTYDDTSAFSLLPVNLLIASFTLLFVNLAIKHKDNVIKKYIYLCGYVAFVPNTIYVITDIIHASNYEYLKYSNGKNYNEIIAHYSTNIIHWAFILLLSIAILISLYMAYISIRKIEIYFINKRYIMIYRATISSLIGIAIYMGRILRLNSWNIINPLKIIDKFKSSEHSLEFIIIFILGFTLFTFTFMYLSDYAVRQVNKLNNTDFNSAN